MKTLIRAIFLGKKKMKRNRTISERLFSDQFAKMGKLGQQLVVMSR